MGFFTLAFLLGHFLWQSSFLQQIIIFLIIWMSILLCYSFSGNLQTKKIIVWMVFFIAGYLYLQLRVDCLEKNDLRADEMAKIASISGIIQGIPRQNTQLASFNFAVSNVNQRSAHLLVHLNWFNAPALASKSQCFLKVKLYRPRGLVNPGGFDFAKWAFAEHIRAVGNVLSKDFYCFPSPSILSISHLRESILKKLNQYLSFTEMRGFIQALTIGVQNQIAPEQWQVLQATGTNHLVAIAGVHLGFVSLFFYGFTQVIWRLWPQLSLWLTRKEACLIMSFVAASFYALLTGFALPAQRAFIMALLFLVFTLQRKIIFSWQILCLSLWIFIIINPLQTLQMSFWLSFGAVGLILFGMQSKLKMRKWRHFLKLQWILSLGLLPCSLIFFNQFSLIAFVANLFAVPAIGLGILPLCILGLFFVSVPSASHLIWQIAAKGMEINYHVLSYLAGLKYAVWYQTMPNQGYLFLSLCGMLLLLSPGVFPLRCLGWCWLAPLFFYKPSSPKNNEFFATLLDVGQGLAVVIETSNHVLIYDTGPKFKLGFDAGRDVVIPYLHLRQIKKINILMISHGDNDHAGGVEAIEKNFPVTQMLTSATEKLNAFHPALCQSGQHWQWDGVNFAVLYPLISTSKDFTTNNRSCVLQISTSNHRLLLVGDIEKAAEEQLLDYYGRKLNSEVLIAPHHGSKTSSSLNFLHAVMPHYVLFAVGEHNRFHFPALSVVHRYQDLGAAIFSSAQSGAIRFEMNADRVISWQEEVLNRKSYFSW